MMYHSKVTAEPIKVDV